MPLTVPTIDSRRYQDLLDEALNRIRVHNPEWTNYNRSDPGVTLIELFAFLTESLLYRSNQIPERNRRKFLTLLGVPLKASSPARGLVTFSNEVAGPQTVTLNDGLEVRAGQVPFRTTTGLDVLPVEARAYVKRPVPSPSADVRGYYEQLYLSYAGLQPQPADLRLYETVPLATVGPQGVDLTGDTADGSLWIALLLRVVDRPTTEALRRDARRAIAEKTLSLGVVPVVADASVQLPPAGAVGLGGVADLDYQLPLGGELPANPADRVARYRRLETRATVDVLAEPGVVQLTLPDETQLGLWDNLDPLESGVGEFPPPLEDTALADRVITWLRIRAASAQPARILWAGVNAVTVTQRTRVAGEVLPDGTGEPDQTVTLSRSPVLPGSVRLTVTPGPTGAVEAWTEIDDLLAAGPEVVVPDPQAAPGTRPAPPRPADVFALDPEAGRITFGDGLNGRRPPPGALLRADYDYGLGRAGNVGPGAVATAPALPTGLKVTNPVRTWGGADAETVTEGEKQVARYLQHRDRLVTAEDFATLVRRTPGVDLGRVDVLAAFNPELTPSEPGDAPGAVTLLVIPRFAQAQPDAPRPDRFFLDAICHWLDQRRLVTTELFLRGPVYRPVWVSVGLDVVPGESLAVVRERVQAALRQFLSPLPAPDPPEPAYAHAATGWPLRKPVEQLELVAQASRVRGVRVVNGLLLAEGGGGGRASVELTGLQLPRVAGLAVVAGPPPSLDELRGTTPPAGVPSPVLPVPVVPEEC
jgi:hypothetical protein